MSMDRKIDLPDNQNTTMHMMYGLVPFRVLKLKIKDVYRGMWKTC